MALSCKLIFCGHSSKKTAIIIFSAIKNNHLGGLVSGYNVQAAKRKVKEHLSYHLLKATSKSETGSGLSITHTYTMISLTVNIFLYKLCHLFALEENYTRSGVFLRSQNAPDEVAYRKPD